MALLIVFLTLWIALASSKSTWRGPWRQGRGTFYGDQDALWSIHRGSCGYGYIWPDEPQGWNVAALPDKHPDFKDSCGVCYEIKCSPTHFEDGYRSGIDRKDACIDKGASVVIKIVDSCPCEYPDNQYSNKRWCCGDMDHFDLSVWAFEKLADRRWGVIGLEYRRVPCDFKPEDDGGHMAAPSPDPTPGILPSANAINPNVYEDTYRYITEYGQLWAENLGYTSKTRDDSLPTSPTTSTSVFNSIMNIDSSSPSPSPSLSTSSSATQTSGGNSGSAASEVVSNAGSSSSEGSSTPSIPTSDGAKKMVYWEGLENGFYDSSWYANVNTNSGGQGLLQSAATCAYVQPQGALTLKTETKGVFSESRDKLDVWVMTDGGRAPKIHITLSGPKGSCRPNDLSGMDEVVRQGNYSLFSFYMVMFDWNNQYDDGWWKKSWNGCGGNGSWDLNAIEFRNLQNYAQWICIDNTYVYRG